MFTPLHLALECKTRTNQQKTMANSNQLELLNFIVCSLLNVTMFWNSVHLIRIVTILNLWTKFDSSIGIYLIRNSLTRFGIVFREQMLKTANSVMATNVPTKVSKAKNLRFLKKIKKNCNELAKLKARRRIYFGMLYQFVTRTKYFRNLYRITIATVHNIICYMNV